MNVQMGAFELKIWFFEFNSVMTGLKENLILNYIIKKKKKDNKKL